MSMPAECALLEEGDQARPMCLFISVSEEMSPDTVDPKYVNSCTSSSLWSLTLISGECSMPWTITLVFFMLIVMLMSWQTWEKRSIKCCNCCSVCEAIAASSAKSSDDCLTNFCLCSQSGKVEKCPIRSVDTFCGWAKGMLQNDSTEDAKQGWSKYAPLLYTTANPKGIRRSSIKLHDTLHVGVERLDHIEELGWASNLD